MKDYVLKLLNNLKHSGTIAGLVLAVLIPFFVYLGPNVGQKKLIQQLDLSLPLPLFIVQLVLGVVLVAMLRKDLREWFMSILPQKQFTILACAFALFATIFAATQIDARHRVESDESIFFSIAQSMYYNQQSGTCNQGEFTDGSLKCFSTSNSFKTKGLSFLYLMGMPLLGTNLSWVFAMELLLLPLAILLMFFAIVAWTRQPLLGFFAALLMALQPTVLFQFRSMSVEPLYVFLSALSLLVFKWAYDRNTLKHWALSALVLAFFAQTRQETVFCFAPFILAALPKLLNQKSAKTPVFFLLLSLFTVPVLLTISYFQGFGFQGGEFSAHGHFLEDVAKNWEVMTKPLKENGELQNPFLTYFNYLFAIGGIYLIGRALWDAFKGKDVKGYGDKYFYLKVLAFVVLYHIQTYVILENVSGDFSIEINQRYSLVMIPTMAFLAALPIAHAVEYLTKSSLANRVVLALFVAVGFSLWTGHYQKDFNNNVMYNRNHLTVEEHEILGWLKNEPQKDRFFIYGRPWHFVGYGISSIHYDRARSMSSEDLQSLVDKYQGEVYYIRGLDCWDSQTYHKKAVEHRIATTCDVFEREMDLVGVKNILITNNYWLQIAKFNGRKNYNPEKIISTAEPKADAEIQDSLILKYDLNEKGEAADRWEFLLALNNKIEYRSDYKNADGRYAVSTSALLPGFNEIRYVVNDNATSKKLVDLTKFYFNPADDALDLSRVDYESNRQDWGDIKRNRSIEGHTLTVNGVRYANGYGVHASSETTFDVARKYGHFRAMFGLDDESLCSEGVRVEIWGDNQMLASTPAFRNGVVYPVAVNIDGVQKLVIKTISVGNSIDCSHVDIINPMVSGLRK